jgi:predicted aldo/keto reductase-like oxidoreductase
MQQDERNDPAAQEAPRRLTRREFVRTLSAATAGGGLITAAFAGCSLTPSQRAEAAEALVDELGKLPKVKLSKRVGGMEIARIALCQDSARDLVGPSLAVGMNFFHKASYWREVPEEIKARPRESYYTDITVDNTSPGHDPDNYDEAYNQVITQLDRTGLRYFDIFRAHYGWHTLASFNKGMNASYRAFQRLKREGKVRYFGVSQHAAPRENYETYATMIQAQIDSGLIDSMQLWFSYDSAPQEIAIFEKAHKAGIHLCAMKTNAFGRGKMLRDEAKQAELKAAGLPGRACIRYVLGLKGSDGKRIADNCVSSLSNMAIFEENIGAVATKTAQADRFIIEG